MFDKLLSPFPERIDDKNILSSLDDIPLGKNIYLYGLGEGYVNFKRSLLSRPEVNVVGLLDDSKCGQLDRLQIKKPEVVDWSENDLVLITSAYWLNIACKLSKIQNVNFMVVNPNLFYDYMIFSDTEIEPAYNKFKLVMNLFSNNYEKQLFKALFTIRTTDCISHFGAYSFLEKHFEQAGKEYMEYVNFEHISCVIEGGVFDGESTSCFMRLLNENGMIFGFEPNHDLCFKGYQAEQLKNDSRFKLYENALWDKKERVNFFENIDNTLGARIVDIENQKNVLGIDAISIDEFLDENDIGNVDYIKFDIEGAEMNALKGALKTIHKMRPQLAISIYHKKQDFLDIPLFLNDILESYTFHLGHYSKTYWDTVLYAIPNELINKN